MTLSQLRSNIISEVLGNSFPDTKHYYDETLTIQTDNLKEFIRVSIELEEDTQVATGSNSLIRTHGELQFQIMVRAGDTSKLALDVMEHYKQVFTNKVKSAVNYRTFTRQPPVKVGDWYMYTTEVRFNALTSI